MHTNGFIKTLLTRLAETTENATVICLYDGVQVRNVSASALLHDILQAAGTLHRKGIQQQHIALAGSGYAWLVIFCGILASGNVAVPLNPDLPEAMLRQQCTRADVTYGWHDSDANGGISEVPWLSPEELRQGTPLPLESVYEADAMEVILLLGTSGTTGTSKLAALTDGNLCSSLEAQLEHMTEAGMTRSMLSMPLYHIGGIACALLSLLSGKTLCVGRGSKYLFLDLPKLQPTYLSLVPSMLDSFVKLLKRNPDPSDRVKLFGSGLKRVFVGGAASKISACQYLLGQGFIVDTGYAMTETTGVGTWCSLQKDRLDTVGKPSVNLQIRICDGELQLSGPCVMQHYYRDPEETAQVLEDGWLHTGDLGVCDEEGWYSITGRKKNVIILSGGENVNPAEIEKEFVKCPQILECSVYTDGRGICADVYTQAQEKAAGFIHRYNEEMPNYRQVYKVRYTDVPLEKTGSGKILRKGQ